MNGPTFPDVRLSAEELERVRRARTRRLAIETALLSERRRLGRELDPREEHAARARAEQDLRKKGATA